ncbi:hypothetical protein ASPZODRAFT_58651 [Penicilliopsis zonata CBS 506.65]|uniref:Auxiliary Activity family 9 catalytic domain-containing protein n=1 Tax=Penicilliopsis zonata CBS 506.65 TaxID=1073090 RepID=A0A1L9SRN2_9EURO|nr:hypothetical protein ASPZODRAFT_58651 [Penicilliopsis zonata CBS 506.65]OJJ49869.1 hypothetical protein ASPZODRAFT_58651 [Penicilliopsis zonata CBS 506.65]
MTVSKITGLILGSAALVAGHGYVQGILIDGESWYSGYIVTEFPYESDPPEVIAWAEDETDLGYIDGTEYAEPNIICHKNGTPAALSADIKAGGTVELQWTDWPTSHHGPVITYLANCNGDCSSVDKTELEFFKIDQGGLINDTAEPGTWASDELIANNNSWTVTIPTAIASGNYVLRHEIIALHSAEELNGAQNYPQCINLNITSDGTDTPTGTLGEALYNDTDPGILIDIYQSLSTYVIPGPTLYSGSGAEATVTAAAAGTVYTTDYLTATAYATEVVTAGSSPQQTEAAGSSDSSSSSSSSTTSSASSASSSTAVSSSSLTSYFDSLSASQLLEVIESTVSWLVSSSKVHARDLTV